jgi:hypothetical protein
VANNFTIQWQAIAQTIANIQAQLNSLSAQSLPGVSGGTAGQFPVINAAGSAYILVPLSGDLSSSSLTPGLVAVVKVNGNPVAATTPTPGQIWLWNGTQMVPVSIGGDGTINTAGVLTLSKFGGVTPNFTAGSGVSITGSFPAYVISSTVGGGYSSLSTITNGVPAGSLQSVTIQLNDSTGTAIAAVQVIHVYMATDSAGAVPSTVGVGSSVTVTTGALLKAQTAKLYFDIVTNASGQAVLSFDNTGGGNVYTDRVVLILPAGGVLVGAPLGSGAVNFTPTMSALPTLYRSPWGIPGLTRGN